MIKGVVFDMDGLMFDTERLSLKCWIEAGRQMGYQIPPDLPPRTNGLDAAHSCPIFRSVMGENFDYYAVRARRLELERQMTESASVPVKQGLFGLLDYLRERDIPAAVASSSDKSKVERYLKSAGAWGYMSVVIDGGMVKNGKPDPEIFLLACSRLGLPPQDCLALEDSPAGVESAVAAGLTTVMVPDTVAPQPRQYEIALAVVPSLDKVPGIIENINASSAT